MLLHIALPSDASLYKHNCTALYSMQSSLNLQHPLQGKIRNSFMNKDVPPSFPLFIVLVWPRMLEVELMGDREVKPLLPIVEKIYHLTPSENLVQEMNS